jgi:transglutaminase-like putative cysteine protease
MPGVKIEHSTEYRYKRPVRFTTHRLMLRPRDSHDLRLLSATLGLYPRGGRARWAHDVFGNSVCFLDWVGAESDTLRIVSTLELEHFPPTASDPHVRIDPQAEIYPFAYAAEEFPDLARTLERHYPDPERLVDTWARRFIPTSGSIRTLALLTAMTNGIKQDFAYERRDQEGTNSPLVTLAAGRGACRDFALLMMEAARSLGFAAQFVSGYLYDEALANGADAVVGGATHAWCSIYLPGAGWVEFDPTNGLIAGRNLVRVCVARTPQQAVPISGAYVGSLQDRAGMAVDVRVTVGEPRRERAMARGIDAAPEPQTPGVSLGAGAVEGV